MSPGTATILFTYCVSSEKTNPHRGFADRQTVTMSPRVGWNNHSASGDVIKLSLSRTVGIIEAPETTVGRITKTIHRTQATTVTAEEAPDLVFIRDISSSWCEVLDAQRKVRL